MSAGVEVKRAVDNFLLRVEESSVLQRAQLYRLNEKLARGTLALHSEDRSSNRAYYVKVEAQ